jgi:hypothetical protein
MLVHFLKDENGQVRIITIDLVHQCRGDQLSLVPRPKYFILIDEQSSLEEGRGISTTTSKKSEGDSKIRTV